MSDKVRRSMRLHFIMNMKWTRQSYVRSGQLFRKCFENSTIYFNQPVHTGSYVFNNASTRPLRHKLNNNKLSVIGLQNQHISQKSVKLHSDEVIIII